MELTSGFENIVRENEPLAPYTRLRTGGVAEFFAEPTSLEELVGLVRRFNEAGVPVRLLGAGSNLLIRDEGVEGLVISLAAPAFCHLAVEGDTVTVGGGTRLSHLVSRCIGEGFSGIENLVGIPGTVGGALHLNAGNQHASIGDWAIGATAVTRRGEVVSRGPGEMTFGYRQSSLNELVIVSAVLKFELEDSKQLTKRMQKLWIFKRSMEPAGNEYAAYAFHDEGGESAGKLIELAGLRGARIGGAEISSRDANFVVVAPNTSSNDVLRLLELVQKQVLDRTGIHLRQSLVVW